MLPGSSDRPISCTAPAADVHQQGSEAKIVIFDDIFPHLLSAFRIAEFNYYLRAYPNTRIYTDPSAFKYVYETRSFEAVRADYEALYPELAGRCFLFADDIAYRADCAYVVFLRNAYRFIETIETNRLPFAFTLYPGGGFAVNTRQSDEKLQRVCASPYLQKIIVTQSITRDYLFEKRFVDESKVEFIYGGVFPTDVMENESVEKRYYRRTKESFDVCFVANKYMPRGEDKGYDVFIDVAKTLSGKFADIHFHVVGPYDHRDIDVSALADRITFYGVREPGFFPRFYSGMDIFLSPNIPFVLGEGMFDGFPTGCCVEAGVSNVALFCTDPLRLNQAFENSTDIEIVPYDREQICTTIQRYYSDVEKLYALAANGQRKMKALFNMERQMVPRTRILSQIIESEHMKKSQHAPVVSVWMITYNHGKFIREAIDAVLMQQTEFPFELVIGEDISTDDTRAVCEEYAAAHPERIRLLPSDKKYGMIPNFIRTIQACRGKYIALCEGDDYWTDPLKLQRQVDLLEANPEYAGCFHETQQIFEDGTLGKVLGRDAKPVMTAEDTIATGCPFHTSSFMYKNVLNEFPRWYQRVISADMALFSLASSFGPLGKIPHVMSVYRKHENGITNTPEVINSYHQKRMELMKDLNEYHRFQYDAKAKEVIGYHERELLKAAAARNEIDRRFLNPPCSMENMDLYLIRKGILNALTAHLPAFTGTLLDLGCGQMPYRQYILSNSRIETYLGLDIENPLHHETVKPDLYWDGKTIPLEENSVDVVIATELFEHLPDIQSVLRETERVLKPGGMLFFTVPYQWPLHETPHDEYRYTPFSLERHLSAAKFSAISLKPTGGWDASLAQMIGLWTRRRPMSDEERGRYAELYFPVFQSLVNSEVTPERFTEGLMITGITGTARKSGATAAVETNETVNDVSLAIFTPNLGTLSETFIKKQIDFLAPGKTVVVYGNMFNPQWISAPTLQIPYTEGPAVYAPDVEENVAAFLAEHKVTHILVEYGCYGTEIIEMNARRLGLPIWVHFHGADASQMIRTPKMAEYYKWMGQQVTGVITVAGPMTDRLIRIGIPAGKITINHYGIDIPPQISAEPEKDPCRFIFVGRLVAKKAPKLLLKAFSIAYARYPAMHLDIVGGDFREGVVSQAELELQQFVDEHDLAHAVTLHGAVRNDKVKVLLNRSSVYVQHSVTVPENGDAEGLPNTILEACAHGLPVISTLHEGIPEEIDHGRTGFLGKEFDCDQMAEFMVRLAKNPALRKEMGSAGRAKIEQEFSVEHSIRGLRSILFDHRDLAG